MQTHFEGKLAADPSITQTILFLSAQTPLDGPSCFKTYELVSIIVLEGSKTKSGQISTVDGGKDVVGEAVVEVVVGFGAKLVVVFGGTDVIIAAAS